MTLFLPNSMFRAALVFLLLLSVGSAFAQKTLVTGRVIDQSTGEPLPYVNIVLQNTKIGTTSDIHGNYRIETYYGADSIVASLLGYGRVAAKIKEGKSQVVDFQMSVSGIALGPVTVTADKRTKEKDPAIAILKQVIRNKSANNREKLAAYEYRLYNKIEFDMNNINERFKNNRVMKPFEFIFENIDSTSEEKPFLPMFLTESVSQYFYRKSPRSSKEVIEATKVAGLKNESVSQFLGDMYQGTNIYENYVEAFGKSFVSPISDFGQLSYKYYLLDSASLSGHKCYQIAFVPRRKGELVFEGEMWISDTTFAVKQIEASIREDANINWINGFKVYHEYDEVEPEVWMLSKEKVVIDFNVTDNSVGFYGRKTTVYSDFVINKPKDDAFYSSISNIEVAADANEKAEEFWQDSRPERLSEKEQEIYQMVDTIKNLPAFRTYVDVITLFVTGYLESKYVDFGPYFTFFSFNQIEGARVRFGGKTNSDFSTKVEFNAYGAFGFQDQKFKYNLGGRYFLSKKPRQIMTLGHQMDLEQLGTSANAWRTDNILSSVFRRSPNNLLNGFEQYSGSYEIEYFPGLSNKITYTNRGIWALGAIPFIREVQGETEKVNRITTSEVSFTTRFAYDEKFISGELDRLSLGTRFPIIQANVALGVKGFLNGEYEYQRLVLNIQDRIPINPIGQLELVVEGGKIWGQLPFPLLNLFNGNETYFYDNYAFNLMNFYEFVSDRWVNCMLVHHFNGLFLNKIPLMRRLKWREVATFRAAIGELDNKHKQEMNFPNGLSTLDKPYFEAGVGVENILKIFRVDALWRLSYLDNPRAVPFGIRTTFQFDF